MAPNPRRSPVAYVISTVVSLIGLTIMSSITAQNGTFPVAVDAVRKAWADEDPQFPDPTKVSRELKEQAQARSRQLRETPAAQKPAQGQSAQKKPAASQQRAATSGTQASSAPPALTPRQVRRTIARIKALPVKGRAPMTGYSRDQFGQAWSDKDQDGAWRRNGCDTRNDMLARDLIRETFKAGTNNCKVLSGVMPYEPYTGQVNRKFDAAGAYAYQLDIDHMVALGNAWVTGAAKWTPEKRAAIANDSLNLLSVDPSQNRTKGDADAATWLPPNKPYRCLYVNRQSRVKAKYGLWVTAPERDAMLRVMGGCAR